MISLIGGVVDPANKYAEHACTLFRPCIFFETGRKADRRATEARDDEIQC